MENANDRNHPQTQAHWTFDLDDHLAIADARLAGILAPHGGTVRHGLRLGRNHRSMDIRLVGLGLSDHPIDPRHRRVDRVRETKKHIGRHPFGTVVCSHRVIATGDVDSEYGMDDEGVGPSPSLRAPSPIPLDLGRKNRILC